MSAAQKTAVPSRTSNRLKKTSLSPGDPKKSPPHHSISNGSRLVSPSSSPGQARKNEAQANARMVSSTGLSASITRPIENQSAGSLPPPSRPPPPVPSTSTSTPRLQSKMNNSRSDRVPALGTAMGPNKANPRPPWNSGTARSSPTPTSQKSAIAPLTSHPSSSPPVFSRFSAQKASSRKPSSPGPSSRVQRSSAGNASGSPLPIKQKDPIRRRPISHASGPTATNAAPGVIRRTSVKAKVGISGKRPSRLDLSSAKKVKDKQMQSKNPGSSIRNSTSPAPGGASLAGSPAPGKVSFLNSPVPGIVSLPGSPAPGRVSLPNSPAPVKISLPTAPSSGCNSPVPGRKSPFPTNSLPSSPRPIGSSPVHVQQVLNELRETYPSPSPTTSYKSATLSPSRTIDTIRTSDDVSKSPLCPVFLVPQKEPSSRRTSDGTIFDHVSPRSSLSQGIANEEAFTLVDTNETGTLTIPESSPRPQSSGYDYNAARRRSKSPIGKAMGFITSSKGQKGKSPIMSTLSALEVSLGTLVSASISTTGAFSSKGKAVQSSHTRKYSAKFTPPPAPEFIEAERKRTKIRFKIINEMIVTEYTFLQDMIALEESYNAFTGECPTITARHKQTIFGKVKNVLSFTDKFHKELVQAADSFLKRTEDSIMNCTYEELVKWDSDVSVGETFWSSMVRIEKAYTGYCTHQEEASQTMLELEKNEAVKLWLEECKRRGEDRTKAWDIHSLLIKPVQRVLKYPLLLQELLNVTSPSHSDFECVELAAKEITKVAERINESKRRKEVCDRILAKGRSAVHNINTDLSKFLSRKPNKLRLSFNSNPDWQDETSELYEDLVSKFAKQAIQVQVLARDLECWIVDYRAYLTRADSLIAALKAWMTCETKQSHPSYESWEVFFVHIESVSSQIFPVLQKSIQTKCIQPLQNLYDAFKGPAALIAKHNRKAIDFGRYHALKAKDEMPDKKLIDSANTFQSLHDSLLEELPVFLSLTCEFVEAIVNQFSIAQAAWYQGWMEELLKLTSDPFLIEQSTTEAFVGIVANFLEHFESQTDILESFSIINGHPSPNTKTQKLIVGDAVRRASRAPSLTALASEEHARLSQLSGMVNSPQFVSPERTPKHELPAVFPGSSPLLSKDQRKRLGSFDDTTSSSQRAICRAFSLNSFHGNPERVDGFPYLSYSTGQEFDVVFKRDERWLARIPGTDEIGWIPKSHCIEILPHLGAWSIA